MSYGKKSGPENPILPPIDFDPPSNGEYCPTGPTELGERRHSLWRRLVEEKHRRLGLTRRQFAESACGVATWLFVINQIGCGDDAGASSPVAGSGGQPNGAGGNRGSAGAGGGTAMGGAGGSSEPGPDAGTAADAGSYDVQPEMTEDMGMAREALSGDEFIFDIQNHVVSPESPWDGNVPDRIVDFLKLIFVDSDTTIACVSGVPSTRNQGLDGPRARVQIQELVEKYGGSRLLFHCNTEPDRAGEADYMAQAADMFKNIAAWKSYPQGNPGGLAADNILGTFVDAARMTGIKIIASHRGLDAAGYNANTSPLDVVRAAKAAPDMKFIVYHSGYQGGDENHGYDPNAAAATIRGVDRFVRAMQDEGLGPNSNVYAELGTTWRNLTMRPADAAHVIGKLLRYVGEDRVCWGTDCVMGGSPQGQIAAMRMLNIPQSLQQQFGYPALTNEIRRKIFGLNGAAAYGVDPAKTRYVIKDDDIEKIRMARLDDPRAVPMPDRRLYEGPRTRRDFFAFLKRERAAGGHA